MPGNYHRGSIWPPNSRMNLFIPRRQTISPTDAVRTTLATPMSAQKLPQNDDFVHSRIRSTILSLILRRAMEGMILGEAPDFAWVMEQFERSEVAINGI